MSIDDTLQQTIGTIPECLAGGVVDLATGMLIGIKTVDSHPQEVMDFLAAATADLFQGANVVSIENTFKKSRGKQGDNRHYFQEMIVMSDNLLHVFLRAKDNQDIVACFVCRKTANLGMALTKSRAAMPAITAAS
jgi:hypothetical protein